MRSDLFLDVFEFWGVVTTADVDLAVEAQLRTFPPQNAAARLWLRSMARGFSPCDPLLAAALVQDAPLGLPAIEECLGRLGHYRAGRKGLTAAPRSRQAIFDASGPAAPSSGVEFRLWTEGALDWLGGSGYVTSAPADCTPEEVEHRMWMGQQETILPIAERVRQEIVAHLRGLFGDGWVSLFSNELVDPDWVLTEYGGLVRLFDCSRTMRRRTPDGLETAVRHWHWVRNQLSHGKPVSLEALEQATEAYRSGLVEK